MAPMFNPIPQGAMYLPTASDETTVWQHTQTSKEDSPMKDFVIVNERAGNGRSPLQFSSVNVHKRHSSSNETKAPTRVYITPYSDNKTVDMGDRLDVESDSGSEYGDVIAFSQKRKRRTNNSFAIDLEDPTADAELSPPLKRLDFTPLEKEKGVLVGVWRDSPASDPAGKHAVYCFVDAGDRLRRKIMPETRDGHKLLEGFPYGTGKAFTSPEKVILDSHLLPLSRLELKEYVLIRSATQNQNETLEERKKAESLAILEAKKTVMIKTAQNSIPTARSIPPTPIPLAQSPAPGGLKMPAKGILIGYWRASDALQDIDKHAIYAAVDGVRLRHKIVQFTRDGRPYRGNFPSNHGGYWVSYEDVILEPPLARLTRLELTHYVRIRQSEEGEGGPGTSGAIVNVDVIDRALASVAAEAKALGVDPAKASADSEVKRRARNEYRKTKESAPTPGRATQGTPMSKSPPANFDTPSMGTGDVAGFTHPQTPIFNHSAILKPAEVEKVPNTGIEMSVAKENGDSTKKPQRENSAGKPTAIRSSKADADAMADKLRKIREATARAKEAPQRMEARKEQEGGEDRTFAMENESLNDRAGLSPSSIANERKIAIEHAARRYGETVARDEAKKQAEIKKRTEERERVLNEEREFEKNRLVAEQAEAKRRAEAEERAEAKRRADAKERAEAKGRAEAKRKAEEEEEIEERTKRYEEMREATEKRLEEIRKEKEKARLEEEKQAKEKARLEEERQAKEKAKLEEERQAEEKARLEEERQAKEKARLEEERQAKEKARLEEERQAKEKARLEAERQAEKIEREEQRRKDEETRKATIERSKNEVMERAAVFAREFEEKKAAMRAKDLETERSRAIEEVEVRREIEEKQLAEAKIEKQRLEAKADALAQSQNALAEAARAILAEGLEKAGLPRAEGEVAPAIPTINYVREDSRRAEPEEPGKQEHLLALDTVFNKARQAIDIKWHNEISYERRDAGPFAGKLVGSKREVININGEDYVEYRVLMRTEF